MQKEIVKVIAYIFMLIFDFSLLYGTFYIVQIYNWNPAWFILSGAIVFSSNPKNYIGSN